MSYSSKRFYSYVKEAPPFTREELPQIDYEFLPDVVVHFSLKDVKCSISSRKLSSLKPSQKEFNEEKLSKKNKDNSDQFKTRRFIISNDGYLVDGHHDWAHGLNVNPNTKVFVITIDLPINKLIARLKQLKLSYKKNIKDKVISKAAISNKLLKSIMDSKSSKYEAWLLKFKSAHQLKKASSTDTLLKPAPSSLIKLSDNDDVLLKTMVLDLGVNSLDLPIKNVTTIWNTSQGLTPGSKDAFEKALSKSNLSGFLKFKSENASNPDFFAAIQMLKSKGFSLSKANASEALLTNGEFNCRLIFNKAKATLESILILSLQKSKTFDDYPEAAKNNAKKVLDWKEKYGAETKGMTQTGWARARQLAGGKSLSLETVKRMAAFIRHHQDYIVPSDKNEPWKSAGYVAWLGWGGDSGIKWAIRTIMKENGETLADLSKRAPSSFKFLTGRKSFKKASPTQNKILSYLISEEDFDMAEVGSFLKSKEANSLNILSSELNIGQSFLSWRKNK